MKQYNLTKNEIESITSVFPLIQHYQQVLEALQLQFRTVIVTEVFKRLDISPELINFTKIDLGSGSLEITDPKEEKKPEETPTTEKVDK